MHPCTPWSCSTCSQRCSTGAARRSRDKLLLVICRRGMGSRAMGCVLWVTRQLTATCLAMRRRVRRESAFAPSPPRTACEAHRLVEVDVCVAPEPLRLVEGSSNASGRVVASFVVAAVAAGCSGAGSTASLQSDSFSRFLDYLAAQRVRPNRDPYPLKG